MPQTTKKGYLLVEEAIERGELSPEDYFIHKVKTPESMEVFKTKLGEFIDQKQHEFPEISDKPFVQIASELMYFHDNRPVMYEYLTKKRDT